MLYFPAVIPNFAAQGILCLLFYGFLGVIGEEQLLSSIVQGGAFVLVAWLFIQTFRVTLPAMQKGFVDEQEKQRLLYVSTIKEIQIGFVQNANQIFVTELHSQRNDFREELSKQRHAMMNIINALNLEKHEALMAITQLEVQNGKLTAAPDIKS